MEQGFLYLIVYRIRKTLQNLKTKRAYCIRIKIDINSQAFYEKWISPKKFYKLFMSIQDH